ncbi:hypothetical protein CMI37_10620 [Candidatus Pacearchaeota archaeon]|jgi:hypothetical protein|nr:hypothetical protein [Candidatus Pacearchaeota archaeon]|tara:strand:- start:1869 stop:2120 length:252 start_codon:yes stop_codon:yes gene_type:complete
MNEPIAAYLEFLWMQFQYDWSWMSNPWVLYTVIPVILYCIFFFFKWLILLAPVTIPIMTWGWCVKYKPIESEKGPAENHWRNN